MAISSSPTGNIDGTGERSGEDPGSQTQALHSVPASKPEQSSKAVPVHNATVAHSIVCPKCGADKIARSRSVGSDRLRMRLLPRRPYRCLRCYNRFWYAEPLTANPGRVRTWLVLISVAVLVGGWYLWSKPTASPGGLDRATGTDPPVNSQTADSPTKVQRSNELAARNNPAQQRKVVEASGFQPPRNANQEISQLNQAGVSKALIRDKLKAAQVLAVNSEEPVSAAAATPQESTAAEIAALQTSVMEMVDQWELAWETGNSERYLDFYASNFKPSSGVPLERWQQQRIARVVPTKQIQLTLSDTEIEFNDKRDVASVTFSQRYRSADYTDDTRKQLVLNRIADQWYIAEERQL